MEGFDWGGAIQILYNFFMFIMIVGMGLRLQNVEVIVASHIQTIDAHNDIHKKNLEFQHEVNGYFKELDIYGRALDERVAYVENTIISGK